jgi:hypothetical protein
MIKDIGILVVADGIGDDVRKRFKHCLTASRPRATFDVVIMGSNKPRERGAKFNKCKLLNKGLKRLFEGGYKVIIQTDIDLICPPALIDKTFELAWKHKYCVHCSMRRISPEEYGKYKEYRQYPFNRWKKMKQIYAAGCWNGLVPALWKKTGGFNEDMIEWGYEDRDWRERSIKVGIKWKDLHKFPLMHVDHPKRTKNVSLRNVEVAKRAKREGKQSWL